MAISDLARRRNAQQRDEPNCLLSGRMDILGQCERYHDGAGRVSQRLKALGNPAGGQRK